MNIEKRIQRLKEKANSAVNSYYITVEDNIKELRRPLSLSNNNNVGVKVNLADGNIIKECVFDQIKYDSEKEVIYVHQSKCSSTNTDEWIPMSFLCEQKDIIYQAIFWLQDYDLVIVDGDTHKGTAIDIWCYSSQSLYFIHKDDRIDCVDWHEEGIDYFINFCGEFAVHRYEWSDAIREIDEHEEEFEKEGYF